MPVLLRRFRRLNNTMLGALDSVVGPAREQVGGVDDDGVFDGGRIDEGVVGGEDLQAAGHVLEEEGDGAVVGVGACADAALVLLEFACRAGGVVEESDLLVSVYFVVRSPAICTTHLSVLSPLSQYESNQVSSIPVSYTHL